MVIKKTCLGKNQSISKHVHCTNDFSGLRALSVLPLGRSLNKTLGGKCYFSTSNQQSKSLLSRFRWFGIPITLGVSCVGLLHLRRVLWKERDNPASPHPMTWQVGGK